MLLTSTISLFNFKIKKKKMGISDFYYSSLFDLLSLISAYLDLNDGMAGADKHLPQLDAFLML